MKKPKHCFIVILVVLVSPIFLERVYSQASFRDFETNFNKHIIDLDLILPGGPPKDGIPALTNPKFIPLKQAVLPNDMRGMFVDINGDKRFYPYSILVWHEIVNDVVGGMPVAVTFCPLCGSALLFDRAVDGVILEFGVSGFLYQSNVLMYDRGTESFWSQSLRKAVVGDFTTTELEILPFQLITFGTVKDLYPNTQILSTDTGFNRNYTRYPYGEYDQNMSLMFPVLKEDDRYHPKKLMYVFYLYDTVVAVDTDILSETALIKNIDGKKISITKQNEQIAVEYNNSQLPGYWEMWFSWFVHHGDSGIVLDN